MYTRHVIHEARIARSCEEVLTGSTIVVLVELKGREARQLHSKSNIGRSGEAFTKPVCLSCHVQAMSIYVYIYMYISSRIQTSQCIIRVPMANSLSTLSLKTRNMRATQSTLHACVHMHNNTSNRLCTFYKCYGMITLYSGTQTLHTAAARSHKELRHGKAVAEASPHPIRPWQHKQV